MKIHSWRFRWSASKSLARRRLRFEPAMLRCRRPSVGQKGWKPLAASERRTNSRSRFQACEGLAKLAAGIAAGGDDMSEAIGTRCAWYRAGIWGAVAILNVGRECTLGRDYQPHRVDQQMALAAVLIFCPASLSLSYTQSADTESESRNPSVHEGKLSALADGSGHVLFRSPTCFVGSLDPGPPASY